MIDMRLFLLVSVILLWTSGGLEAAEEPSIPRYQWSHTGPFGVIDQASAQRGLLVYERVCKACHSLNTVAFRHLEGIGFTPEQIKDLAASYTITEPYGDDGQPLRRPGRPSDYFPDPYVNEAVARLVNNGALPPDLSLIVSARKDGVNYITALLLGYTAPPEDFPPIPIGQYYNAYYPGHLIAMPQMLRENSVEYIDGTPTTLFQQAQDLSTFLAFTADMHQDTRKKMGVQVILFLVVFSLLMFLTKRTLWKELKRRKTE